MNFFFFFLILPAFWMGIRVDSTLLDESRCLFSIMHIE